VLLTGKLLKTLDLRNMFIDTQDLEEMPLMTSFTMRCVKVNGGALQDINDRMQNLFTLALPGVFGVTNGNFYFPKHEGSVPRPINHGQGCDHLLT
jgi:hypothetical protein